MKFIAIRFTTRIDEEKCYLWNKKLSFQIHVTSKQIFAHSMHLEQQRVLKTAMHNTKILQKIKKF